MNTEVTDNKQLAAPAGTTEAIQTLERLLAQAYAAHKPDEITVVEEWVRTARGYCRVAIVITAYGTHIEIGSRRGSDSQITWTFREEDLAKATAHLAEYFK